MLKAGNYIFGIALNIKGVYCPIKMDFTENYCVAV